MADVNSQIELEIESVPCPNLISNHSGGEYIQAGDYGDELNYTTAGWRKGLLATLTAEFRPGAVLPYPSAIKIVSIGNPLYFDTEPVPVIPGKWYGARASAATCSGSVTGTLASIIKFYDATNTLIGTATYPAATNLPTGSTPFPDTIITAAAAQAPAGACSARVGYKATISSANQIYLRFLMMVEGASSGSVTGVAWTDAATWTSYKSKSSIIEIDRGGQPNGVTDDMEVGTLTVTTKNADPNTDANLRPGRRIRLRDLTRTTNKQLIFIGRVQDVNCGYDAKGLAHSVITATDAMQSLTTIPAAVGYTGTYAQRMDALIEGPLLISGFQPPEVVTANSVDTGAKLWDQLCRVRNGTPGAYVAVMKSGRIKYGTSAPNNSYLTLSDANTTRPYVSAIAKYAPNQVNSLEIRRINTAENDGDKTYGPYVSAISRRDYGERVDRIEISGNETPETIARTYLGWRNTATKQITEIRVNTSDSAVHQLTRNLDRYNGVTLTHTPSGITAANYLVIGIKHTITPDKWITTLTVRPVETGATIIPITPSGTSTSAPTDALAGSGEWQPLPLNGAVWSDYGAPYQPAEYRVRNRQVELRGLVKNISGVAITAASTIATIAGWPPAAQELHRTITSQTITSGAASAGTAHTHSVTQLGGGIDITTAGAINLRAAATQPLAANGWVSLHDINYSAA